MWLNAGFPLLTSHMTSDSLIHASSPLMFVYPSMATALVPDCARMLDTAVESCRLISYRRLPSTRGSLLPLHSRPPSWMHHVTLLQAKTGKENTSPCGRAFIYIQLFSNTPCFPSSAILPIHSK